MVVGFDAALEVTVIDFLINPTLFVSYFTCIFSDSPGKIGFSGFLGIVHPQVDYTFEIIKGAFPVFLKTNSLTPLSPLFTVP